MREILSYIFGVLVGGGLAICIVHYFNLHIIASFFTGLISSAILSMLFYGTIGKLFD